MEEELFLWAQAFAYWVPAEFDNSLVLCSILSLYVIDKALSGFHTYSLSRNSTEKTHSVECRHIYKLDKPLTSPHLEASPLREKHPFFFSSLHSCMCLVLYVILALAPLVSWDRGRLAECYTVSGHSSWSTNMASTGNRLGWAMAD